ncbi:hypothetical protein [Microbacterium candidum]|uniref:DUF1579 domain-containing protein n=1 Tax=Microbacterium candidum TaxID=3041922 RepID=A0ABT7MZ07_9MICO|nr:hypothetical protein [Microbacterium sp. ASV49]MDL9979690.1 hypothetical protein [Microbacterium sp. ASV49]
MEPDERIASLIGRWSGDEEVSATAWTAAGVAHAELTITPAPGGLVLDYRETRDDGEMTGHGVVSGDGWWWFDSYGFVPAAPGSATWAADSLVLERRSDRGRNVMRLARDGERLTMRLAAAVPADGEVEPLVAGNYARADGDR